MKHFRAALLAALVLCMSFDAVFGQSVPTLSLEIPQFGQTGAPANGAQNLSSVGINGALLRERKQTFVTYDGVFQTASIRIASSSTTASQSTFPVAYSLEYFVIPSSSMATTSGAARYMVSSSNTIRLPNIGQGVRLLPATINVSPALVFTPPLPAPTPVAINGLQGDLSPTLSGTPAIALQQTDSGATSMLSWDGRTAERFANFRARWSDQVYPRNPGYQGVRIAVFRLFPSTATPPAYQLKSGADVAYIFLDDPEQMPPMVVNALPDIVMLRPTGGTPTTQYIELESQTWRRYNVPGFVFYYDNYDPVQYTATSSDFTRVSATIIPSVFAQDSYRSLLALSVQPGAELNSQAVITVRALDGRGKDDNPHIIDEFIVSIRNNLPTAVVAKTTDLPSIATSPNPVIDKCTVSAVIPEVGFFTLRLTDVKGNILVSTSIEGTRGSEQSHTIDMTGFAAGTYFVEVNDGKATSTKKIVKM